MNTTQNRSWLGRLVVAVLAALIGAGATGLISVQVQFGNINIIIGDQNKVENGSQTQSVIQPTKPQTVEAKPQQPESRPISLPTPVEQPSPIPSTPSQVSYRQRTTPIQYESAEDCSCPDDEEATESESEPVVERTYATPSVYVPTPAPRVIIVPSYSQYPTQTISNDGDSQYQTQSSTSGVYVQSNGVTVRTSTNGASTRTRVVINGRVVVDQ